MVGPCERSDGNYSCLDGVAHAAPSIRQPVSDYSVARQVLQIEPVRAKKTAQSGGVDYGGGGDGGGGGGSGVGIRGGGGGSWVVGGGVGG